MIVCMVDLLVFWNNYLIGEFVYNYKVGMYFKVIYFNFGVYEVILFGVFGVGWCIQVVSKVIGKYVIVYKVCEFGLYYGEDVLCCVIDYIKLLVEQDEFDDVYLEQVLCEWVSV